MISCSVPEHSILPPSFLRILDICRFNHGTTCAGSLSLRLHPIEFLLYSRTDFLQGSCSTTRLFVTCFHVLSPIHLWLLKSLLAWNVPPLSPLCYKADFRVRQGCVLVFTLLPPLMETKNKKRCLWSNFYVATIVVYALQALSWLVFLIQRVR